MLILEGIPLFLIELGIGQKMRLGSLGVWNTIHPWLGGIGISSCIVTLFVTLYYNVVITWCFFYLLNSFRVGISLVFTKLKYHWINEIYSRLNYRGKIVHLTRHSILQNRSVSHLLLIFGIIQHLMHHRQWRKVVVWNGGLSYVY